MKKILKVGDRSFELFIAASTIREAVTTIGKNINKDIKGKQPIFLSVLNG